MLNVDDTIAAIASAAGGGLRGIVRISGPATIACLRAQFTPSDGSDLSAVGQASIIDGAFDLSGRCGALPARLYLWPTRRSYTRQIAAELHLAGSPPLLEMALHAIVGAGARIAGPGEFTLRAFLAGRLDLTQAEAVLGVIDARSSEQLRTALSQLAGGLAAPLHQLRSDLLDLLAHLEAGLDFVEEDIEFISAAQLVAQLDLAQAAVQLIVDQLQSRGDATTLPRVVLIGEPNAGKSSLLNALAEDAAAVVSDQAGTTRDYVTRRATLNGVDCLLIDTAGIDAASEAPRAGDQASVPEGSIAAAAQAATVSQAHQADIRLLCLDASAPRTSWELAQLAGPHDLGLLVVLTKIDRTTEQVIESAGAVRTSSITGFGLDELRLSIAAAIRATGDSTVVQGTAARCRESLQQAATALQRAREVAAASQGEELVAAELRSALDDLGRVAGVVYTDDVLDRIFSRFCIGK